MAFAAKMIPATIEAAMFAFFTGLNMLNMYFIGRLFGNLINSLTTKTTKEDLSGLATLHYIQAACALAPLLIIWLLPTQEAVEAVQKKIAEDEKKFNEEHLEENPPRQEPIQPLSNIMT